MITIHKYPLPIQDLVVLNLPKDAVILRVECQAGSPMVWALVDTEADLAYRHFQIFETGHEIEPTRPGEDWDGLFPDAVALVHVATFQDRTYVWHLFERTVAEAEDKARAEVAW